MRKKIVGILVCTLLITPFIPSFSAQSPIKSTSVSSITETYFEPTCCPPNGVGNVQPPYSGKIFGINGWKVHNQTIKDENGTNHTVEVWGLDPIRQFNAY